MVLPNLPWLFAGAGRNVSPVPPSLHANPEWIHRLSYATLQDALAIWNPTFGSDFDHGPLVVSHLPWWGVLSPLLILAAAVISRRRLALLLFGSYVAASFLYKGSQPPWGGTYIWAFQHVPLFNLYREPLKFGAAAALCASIVIAFGIAALRDRPIPRAGFAAAVCLMILALGAPIFAKPGMRIPRVPNPAFAFVERLVTRDSEFSRTLWLPQGTRWLAGTAGHPYAGGVQRGLGDWTAFRSSTDIDDDPTQFVYFPIFEQLLRWNSFRYVVVDCSTEWDATFRSDSYSCGHLLMALNQRRGLRRIATAGPVTVFRVDGQIAPALWSTRNAAEARGAPLTLSAGALTGAFTDLSPVILGDGAKGLLFDKELIFDGGKYALPARETIRIVGADSVDIGRDRGDAIIDHRRLLITRPGMGKVAVGSSTIAYKGTLSGISLARVHSLEQTRSGTILTGDKSLVEELHAPDTFGIEFPGMSIPIYQQPMLRIVADHASGKADFVSVFDLQDDSTGRMYVLVGPPFVQSSPPRSELDVRDFLFRAIIGNESPGALLSMNDAFDGLRLQRVRLLELGRRTPSSQRFSVSVRAANPIEGYAVRSVRTFSARNFSCACEKRVRRGVAAFVLTAQGRRRVGWLNGVVAIHAQPQSYTAIILRQTREALYGLTTSVGVRFRLDRRQIASIEPAPDAAAVDLHLASPANGVLILRGVTDQRLRLQIVLRVASSGRVGWIVQDIPYPPAIGRETSFATKLDLFKVVQSAGYMRIAGAALLFVRRNPGENSPVGLRIEDASVASNVAGPSPISKFDVVNGEVNTNLAAGTVPIAARFSAGRATASRLTPHSVVPSVNTAFKDESGNRWLVFSQRYDLGWGLTDERGTPIRSVHIAAFGLLNSWYVPAGLHGTYHIVYYPDSRARFGGFVASSAGLICVLLVLTLFRKPRIGINVH
jgi:hypothetical protein